MWLCDTGQQVETKTQNVSFFFVVRIVSRQTVLSPQDAVCVCGRGQFIFLTEWLGQAAADRPSSGSNIWLDALLRAGQSSFGRGRPCGWPAGGTPRLAGYYFWTLPLAMR